MTDEQSSTSEAQTVPARDKERTIIIRMWPKTPVLYPMAIIALICSLVAHFAGSSDLSAYPFGNETPVIEEAQPNPDAPVTPEEAEALDAADEQAAAAGLPILPAQTDDPDAVTVISQDEARQLQAEAASDELQKKRVDRNLAILFLLALFVSLFTICVDLDVRWAIIYTSGIVIAVLLLWILNITVGFLPALADFLDETLTPMANAKFYMAVFLLWVLLLAISFIVTRFHYVKVEANEVMVVGGMLERQQRYDTMRMRYTKEIHDVMEYYLPFVRSGRLIFSFPEHSEAVIIDNVLNIKKVVRRLDDIVGSLPHSHQ